MKRNHSQYKHGQYRSPTWNSWSAMKARCLRPTAHAYERYGGRGITICDQWMDFENFLADMGLRPDGMTLDRINNDGNYEPGNCRWATRKQQTQNQRQAANAVLLTARGETRTVSEWSRLTGIDDGTLFHRIRAGWTADDTLKPASSRTAEIEAAANTIGVSLSTIRRRLRKGQTLDDFRK